MNRGQLGHQGPVRYTDAVIDSSKPQVMAKNVVIVGGGHNGLVCACYLAKAGFSVTVLERRGILGGAAVTEEFHPGFRNSVASYTVSLLHPQVIEDLQLHSHGLEILERPINNFLPLPDDDSLTSFPDLVSMQTEVARFSSKDADQLPAFYDALDSVVQVLKDLMTENSGKRSAGPDMIPTPTRRDVAPPSTGDRLLCACSTDSISPQRYSSGLESFYC